MKIQITAKFRASRPTSSPGRFSLAFEVGREKALASAGQTVILIGWLWKKKAK